jgi:hypothetical protein
MPRRIMLATLMAAVAALAIRAVVAAQDPIDPTPPLDGVTFAHLLTAAGAGIAATLVMLTTAVILNVIPPVASFLNGAQLAFLLSLVLYVLAAIAVGVSTLDAGLVVFIGWLTCATSAIGQHQTTARGALTGGPATPT